MAEKEYIEREALQEIFENRMQDNNIICPVIKVLEVIEIIEKQPTANVAPVLHGHWVYDHWCEFKCSECGEPSNSKPYKGKENFCPNCGAKMGGDKNDT